MGERTFILLSLFLNFKERVAKNLLGLAGVSLSLKRLKRNSRNSCFLLLNSENAIIRSSRSIKFSRNLRVKSRNKFRNQQPLKRLAMPGKSSRFLATPLKEIETGKQIRPINPPQQGRGSCTKEKGVRTTATNTRYAGSQGQNIFDCRLFGLALPNAVHSIAVWVRVSGLSYRQPGTLTSLKPCLVGRLRSLRHGFRTAIPSIAQPLVYYTGTRLGDCRTSA